MSVANDLIPRTGPPEDNKELLDPAGVVVEETAFPHPETRNALKESLKYRADRLLDWMRWRLIIDGHFKVTYADSGDRIIGDYDVEVGDWNTLMGKIDENRGEIWRFFMTTSTRRQHLESVVRAEEDPLFDVPNGQLVIVDAGYRENGDKDSKGFIPDDLIVLVEGPDPIGRMFSTGREEVEDVGTLEREYVSLSETVLPELTAPERVLLCRL